MPRGSLGRASIVDAAFAVLAEQGLDGVTARAVAAELGVQAGAIYYHLPDKATLLDEMATAMQRRMVPGDGPGWDGLLLAYGRAVRSVLLEYRDGARLFAGRRLRDPALLTAMEEPLRRTVAAGFPLADAVWALQSVLDLTVGFVIEEQHRAGAEYDPAARRAAIGVAFPLTAAASEPMQADPAVRHEFALGLVVEGLRARTGT